MDRKPETLEYYKKLGTEVKEHNEMLLKENDQMRQVIKNQEHQVKFYRDQVLKFYEPRKRS